MHFVPRVVRSRSSIVHKGLLVLVGLVAIGAAANASAQSGYYNVPPRGPSYAQPYGGPLVPAYEVVTIVRSIGLEPLAPPIRRLATYVVWATDREGMRVRVVVDARYGEVLAVRPAVAWRRAPAGTRYSGSYDRGYGVIPRQSSYRATPRLDARVPLPRSRTAFAAPVPRPRPAGPSGAAPEIVAPAPVSLPADPKTDRESGADGKAIDTIKPPATGDVNPAIPPATEKAAKAGTDSPAAVGSAAEKPAGTAEPQAVGSDSPPTGENEKASGETAPDKKD
jgi:hypothetical protein